MYNTIYTNTPEFSRLIVDISRNISPGLICGSAFSIFPPTNIESGMSTINNLSASICNSAGVDNNLFGRVLRNSAYEAVLGLYPKEHEIKEILSNYFAYYGNKRTGPSASIRPNACHIATSKLLGRGLISGIVTTNYDNCFEKAFELTSKKAVNVLVGRKRRSNLKFDKAIFKIHGCATKGGIVYRLDQEGTLPDWKKRYLKNIIGDSLFIIGYSGQDFDVCPALQEIEFKRIFWVAMPVAGRPDLTPQTERFLRRFGTKATVICGDMRDVLSKWSGEDIPHDPPNTPLLLSKILVDNLDQHEMRLWAARLFGFFGVPSAAAATIAIEKASLPPNDELSFEFEDTQLTVLEHIGRYLDRADKTAQLASKPGIVLEKQIRLTISEAGSAAMGAYYTRAKGALFRAKNLCKSLRSKKISAQLRHRIAWNELVIAGDELDLDNNAAVQRHFSCIKQIDTIARKTGDYVLSQTCEERVETIKKRMGLSVKEASVERDETGAVMMQMGLHVGYITALKTRIERTRDRRCVDVLIRELDNIKLYGRHVTLWRSYKLLMHFERDKCKRLEYFREFEKEISLCQFDHKYEKKMIEEARSAIEFPKYLEDI